MGTISAKRLSKAYRRYPSQRARLLEWIVPGGRPRHTQKWVLQDVTFEVEAGEAVGIVGLNGAGKSTLLKLIAGTTTPTSGSVALNGRVAALLELGLGFHPDFTGRSNAVLAGQLLGIETSLLTSLLPEIVEFAELGAEIDRPVRTYSSGMAVRLAFAVATAVRPDILIVDEALSVGDAYFQHKSFARIRGFREQGTTLLFVSHSAAAVKTLCDRALLLENGRLTRDGPPAEVLDYYNAEIARRQADYEIREATGSAKRSIRSGSFDAEIAAVSMLVADRNMHTIVAGEAVRFLVTARTHRPIRSLTCGILIRDRLGNDVFGTNTWFHGSAIDDLAEGAEARFEFALQTLPLGAGHYSMSVALHEGHAHVTRNFDWWDHALSFEVLPSSGPMSIGVLALPVRVHSTLSSTHQVAAGEERGH